MTAIRPRRSVLYMPGSNARALEKARSLAADALILDLEDAVAPDAKAAGAGPGLRCRAARRLRRARARHPHQRPRHALGRGGSRRGRRGGRPTRSWCRRCARPKPSSPSACACAASAPPERTRVWAMIETPLAILHAEEIASAARDVDTRLDCFVMGTNDLAKETRARLVPGRAPMLPWLIDRRSPPPGRYDLDIVDGVYNALKDEAGFRAECEAGARLRLRRQDPDPSRPDRDGERGLRAGRRTRSSAPARSSPPSRCRRTPARARSRSTAAWSSACTPRWRGGRSPSPRRSPPAAEELSPSAAGPLRAA